MLNKLCADNNNEVKREVKYKKEINLCRIIAPSVAEWEEDINDEEDNIAKSSGILKIKIKKNNSNRNINKFRNEYRRNKVKKII